MSRALPRRRLNRGAIVGGVGAALLAVVVVALLGTRGEAPPNLVRGGEPVPVILVHGYGGTSGSLEAIQARLQREGRSVVAVDLPNRGEGDISESARFLAAAIDATGSPTVDLIGFSLGGVVVRTYVDAIDATKARYAITLASPHHGTDIAGLAAFADPGACTGACAQLNPDSEFLDDLNDPDETPEGPAFVTVWTEDDDTVKPPDSAVLDGALNIKIQDVCPGAEVSHGDIARHPAVIGIIVTTLAGRLEGIPDDCAALTREGA